MSKDVEMLVESGRESGKTKVKQNRKPANPMGSQGAARHLEDDLQKNAETVHSTTQALIDEGFLPSRLLLDEEFLPNDIYDCLTRMDKKDSATKLKALNDFLQIIASEESRNLVNARTFWARFFISFMEDDDPRVRELASKCQQQYVAVLKKDILPVLSRIIGHWWLAQYQMHAAAAAATRSSFHSSFPDAKLPDVLKRFSSDILSVLFRRLTPAPTKASIHDRAMKPAKGSAQPAGSGDLTDDQQLRIAEALDGFSGFVLAITLATLDENQGLIVEMLEKPEFWKISRLQSPKVRQNFCKLLAAFFETKTDWMLTYSKESLNIVVSNLHERDLRTAGAVWELLLLILNKSPDWHKSIDQKKTLMPKLLSLLKHGGFGAASNVFPSLIVLIDKLPDKTPETYDSIISALISGVSVETIRTADSQAICQAICDCLKYMAKKADKSVAEAIIKTHVVPLMISSFFGPGGPVKGVVDLQRLFLTWQTRGGEQAELATIVFQSLADKLAYAAPEVMIPAKVPLWLSSLVDAANRIVPAGVNSRAVMEPWIGEHKCCEELLYHAFRLSYLLYKNSQDPELIKTFLTFLRLISSDLLYQRLKEFIEHKSTSNSPQLVILRQLSTQPLLPQLELFCILLCDCQSEDDAKDMFAVIWSSSSDHVAVIQAIESCRGFAVVDRFFSASHTEDLSAYAESRVAVKDFPGFGRALALLAKVGADMDQMGLRLSNGVTRFDCVDQLKFFQTFFANAGKFGKLGTVYKAITAAIVPAGTLENFTDAVEKEAFDLLTAISPDAVCPEVDWRNADVLEAVRTALKSAPGPSVIEDLKKILSALVGNPGSHLEVLCSKLGNFTAMKDVILGRQDVFLLALDGVEKDEGLTLKHKYWDKDVEQAVLTCCLVLELVSEEAFHNRSLFPEFLSFAAAVSDYIDLNFDTPTPAIHDHDLLHNLHFYKKLLAPVERLVSSGLSVASSSTCAKNELIIISRPANDISELQLAAAYDYLQKRSKTLSPDGTVYKDQLRDRLETLFAFTEFPRTCRDMVATSWLKIEPMRLVPVLLANRCIDPDFSSAMLDVLGTVVIDWIGCLSCPDILEENPKVLVLVQAAMDGVWSILKSASQLMDSGILWVELTEFSFPRILASLLDGLFRFAEASDEYLTERHPLTGRLIVTMCALVQEFAVMAATTLKPVWDTMFNLEFGLPERLAVLHTTPSQMIPALNQLFAPLLLHRICNFQMVAADVLVNVIPIFPSSYVPQDFTSEHFPGPGKLLQSKEQDPSVETIRALAPPIEFLSVLDEAGDIVETMLQEVPLGSSFGGVVPQTDSYTYLTGYLMVWRCIFAWIKNETLEAKQAFAKHLEVSGSFNALLDNLVRLLPLDVVTRGETGQSSETPDPNAKFPANYLYGFIAALTDVEDWSHPVYRTALQEMPMISRSWYSRKQGPVVRQIAAYTAKFISPTVIAHELTSAAGQARQVSFDNFKVNVRPTVAEITAEYRVEVWVAEIVVKIPKDYPLGNVQVLWGRTKGSARDAWDQWVIRLDGFLRRQNGTILDGIIEWKKSVDKKFQGVEACAICLSIVDVKTAAVPQQRCKTCKNKFHTECLNRWFEQQVDPTCPLCREKFFT